MSFAYAQSRRQVQLFLFALQFPETRISQLTPNPAQHPEQQSIVICFFSAFSANFRGGTPCGFLSVKRKVRRLSSPFHAKPGTDQDRPSVA
jgi:hypothetical protein